MNNKPVKILRDGSFKDFKWKDIIVSYFKTFEKKKVKKFFILIKCGDIVEVLADQAFPCDLLMLLSKSEDGKCFITTANLDGETNLKLRSVPNQLSELRTEEDLINFRSVIKYQKPNLNLYEFNGKYIVKNIE